MYEHVYGSEVVEEALIFNPCSSTGQHNSSSQKHCKLIPTSSSKKVLVTKTLLILYTFIALVRKGLYIVSYVGFRFELKNPSREIQLSAGTTIYYWFDHLLVAVHWNKFLHTTILTFDS